MARRIALVALVLLVVASAPAKDPATRKTDRVKKILSKLEAGSEKYRATALRVLGQIGDASCLDAISAQLAAKETSVRAEAARALGRLRLPGSASKLVPVLEDKEVEVQRAGVWALGELQDPSALPEMDKRFARQKELHSDLAIAYGKIGDKRSKANIASALRELNDKDLAYPHVAAALARVSPKDGLAILEKELKGKDADTGFFTAYESAMALGETDLLDAAKFLLARLDRLQPTAPIDVILREAVVNGIGSFRNDQAIDHFIKNGMKDLKDYATAAAVARGLGLTRSPMATTPLRLLLPAKSPKGEEETYEIRRAVLLALGDLGDPTALDAVKPYVDAPDPRVQIAALKAIGGLGAEEGIPIASTKLTSPDICVRYAAAQAIFRIRTEASVEPLIGLMGASKEWLQKETWGMLRQLTGKDFGLKVADWKEWWAKAKDAFEVLYEEDLEDLQGTTVYWGIEITSKKVVFAVDISGSMSEPARQMQVVVSGKELPGDDIGPGVPATMMRMKMGVAKAELLRTLSHLTHDTMFDVISFNASVREWEKQLVEATIENKKKCNLEFVQTLAPDGATNINDTLEKVFKMAGPGIADPNQDLKVDTIFLLTDGTPTAGKETETERILANIRKLNKLHRIRIHAVGVGECNPDFLDKLAAENGGRFVRPDLGQR